MNSDTERETDNRIDEELRAAFAPPPAEHYADVATGVSRPVKPLWMWMAVAAAALLLLLSLFDDGRGPRGPEGHDGLETAAMWVAAYDHAIDSGFGASCCQPKTNFSDKCQEVCGQRLTFAGGEEAEVLGCYCGLPTGGCVGILLQVKGDPVGVFVVPRETDPRPVILNRAELRLARRELGALVLYSLSYEPREQVLTSFQL